MRARCSSEPKTNIVNELAVIIKGRLFPFVAIFISFGFLNNYTSSKGTIRSITLMLLVLSVFVSGLGVIGLASADVINVEPHLLETASNDGTGQVTVTWNYPYENYTVMDYNLLISINGILVKPSPITYSVGDTTKGQYSPLKGKYVWNVPSGQPEGLYQAELQFRTKEAGIVQGGIYWRFRIAKHQGTLIISKYEDLNRNGARDPNEKGLRDWQFQVVSPSNDSYTYTTKEDGNITIDKAAVGTYKIKEIEQPGYNITENTPEVYVSENATAVAKFGNWPVPPKLIITKFEDKNQNGIQDTGELGLSGWQFSVQGPVSFTENTDSLGEITKEVPPGSYTITETTQTDWKPTTSTSQSITLDRGQEKDVKFGNYREAPAKLVITEFEDKNSNKQKDVGEAFIPGWEFVVSGPTSFTDKTGQDGTIVQEVKAGSYTIRESPRQDWISTTGAEKSLSLSPGETKQIDFGNIGPQYIVKFHDLNANGKLDAGEPRLANWRFNIKGPVTITRSTDANGQINLNDLPDGIYNISEDVSNPEWYNTTASIVNVSVPGPDIYFGNDLLRKLQVFKFNDTDNNRLYDQNETGLPGWTFRISGQNEGAVTDSRGVATFSVRANKEYLVSESIQPEWINTTPRDVTVYIDPVKNVTQVLFGNTRLKNDSQIPIDTVMRIEAFNDTNNNGVRDPGEALLPNRIFTISDGDQTFSPAEQGTTNSSGIMDYECPSAGNYSVEEILPPYWCATTPIFLSENMKLGDNKTLEFGNHLCVPANCNYTYVPVKGNLTLTVDDENIIAKKSIDPYVLLPSDHDMRNGSLINYTISVFSKPKIGPTDLVISVDSSGSTIETNENALTYIERGITSFVEAMKKSPNSNLRIGLVSWNDNIDETVPPTANYDQVINASHKLETNEQKLTMYNVGMNGSLAAFNATPQDKAKKVIVFITDAQGEYKPFQNYPDPAKYTVYVLLMGKTQVNETYKMLEDTTKRYNGSLLHVNSSADIASSLNKLAATGLVSNGAITNIEIKDTLPSYLRNLNSGTKPGNVKRNMDGVDWTTTTLNWSIPALQYGKSWSTKFSTVFCWKLQANVVQNGKGDTSQVTYADPAKSGKKSLALPEGEIWLETDAGGKAPAENAQTKTPGFEAWVAAGGLMAVVYLMRWRNEEA